MGFFKKVFGGAPQKPERYVTDYTLSIFFGICHGPVDALVQIQVRERSAWRGAAASQQTFDIDRPVLFGGDKKEGGVRGRVHFLPGNNTQTIPSNLARKLGLTTHTCPAFRGIASTWFYGRDGGFLWAQNNPYMPSTWFRVFRKPRGLSPSKAVISESDANPAHIIYECLTNGEWGMGGAPEMMDIVSFEKAGDTLFAENFGLSLLWVQQESIESFVSEILDHIQGILFISPESGLLTLRLVRDDYDVSRLRELNPDNCRAINRQRRSWPETINEIVVTWTNPENEQEETITHQDPANIAIQGGIVSDTRNYYGVRNATLATKLAVRDLRMAAYPLFSCNIETDRTAWNLLPGDVCLFSWPDDGIEKMVMRVGKIDYGKPGQPEISISMVEDVFSLEQASHTTPVTTGWVDPSEPPRPFEYIQFFNIPYPALIREGLPANEKDIFPRGAVGILAQQTGGDTFQFELYAPARLSTGASVIKKSGDFLQTGCSHTLNILPREAVTRIALEKLGAVLGGSLQEAGDMALIGSGSDFENEWVTFREFDEKTGEWTIDRGCWDTVPEEWPAGTRIWYVGEDTPIDLAERVIGQTIPYQFCPQTSLGVLPLADAPVQNVTINDRAYRPFRPANVAIDGVSLATRTYTGRRPVTIPLSWSTRNRKMEDTIYRKWTDGNVIPEEGQTTRIRCLVAGTTEQIGAYSDLTESTLKLPYVDLKGHRRVEVEFQSIRKDFVSLQAIKQEVHFDLHGYGNNFGKKYGE